MQSGIHLFIPPFLPQRWDIRPDFHKKTSVHRSSKFSGCVFDKASFAARLASSFPLISLWLGSQQNVINLPLDNIYLHACKILFTRGFLLSWLSMACNTDILSENITKRSTVETFTYFTYLVNRFYLCSKYTATISQYITPCSIRTDICRSYFSFNFRSVNVYVTKIYFCLNSLNRLIKIVQEVDDLSNSDKVKSTVTGLESQIGTSGILLIAKCPNIYLCFLQCFLTVYSKWICGWFHVCI